MEKIYHKKKVLVLTKPKREKKKPTYKPDYDTKKPEYGYHKPNYEYLKPEYEPLNGYGYENYGYEHSGFNHDDYKLDYGQKSTYYEPSYNANYDHNYQYFKHDNGDYNQHNYYNSYGKHDAAHGNADFGYGSASTKKEQLPVIGSKGKSHGKKSSSHNTNHDYQYSSSDLIASVSHDGELVSVKEPEHTKVVKDIYKPKKKDLKKTTFIAPMSEFASPTNYYPYDADEGEEVEHVEFSTEDGKEKDINPKNIIDKIRKFLTKEKINLKVNIDYNKDRLKHDRSKPERQRNRSVGEVIDDQIKKLEHNLEEEHYVH